MKKLEQISRSLVLGSLLLLIVHPTQAQFLKKVKQEVKSRVERKVSKEVGDAAEDAIDQGMGKSRAGDKEVSAEEANGPSDSSSPASFSGYKSYDFVPGDRTIFQPDLSKEADAELPARFVIKKGNAETQSFQGEKILHLDAGGYVTVMPLMDKSNYLPEQFTLEFDFMYENPRKDYFDQVNNFTVKFF